MSNNSAIEWTDATWNPISGCSKVSPGCANCYIERTPPFRIGHRKFDEKGTTGIRLHPERLEEPLHWKKPRRVFVNSLSDLFHESVPDDFLNRVFQTMAKAQNHIFQILTKRPQRMSEYMPKWKPVEQVFPNVWLGVSVENQHFADERIPLLLQTPAAVRFISAEPLLGLVDIGSYLCGWRESVVNHPIFGPEVSQEYCEKLDWIIVGGESGPGARPMHPDWARSLRDQCQAAGVKFFFKQWGEWVPSTQTSDMCPRDMKFLRLDGTLTDFDIDHIEEFEPMGLVGKKAAGRLLDGREWNEYPQ